MHVWHSFLQELKVKSEMAVNTKIEVLILLFLCNLNACYTRMTIVKLNTPISMFEYFFSIQDKNNNPKLIRAKVFKSNSFYALIICW